MTILTDNYTVVRTSPWGRFCWWLGGLFADDVRAPTAEESRLRDELTALRVTVTTLTEQLRLSKADADALRSVVKINELEISKLIDVCERDRQRVHAEHASLIAKIAALGRGEPS